MFNTKNTSIFILAGFFIFNLSSQASAELYRWTDEHGNVHFSDKKNSLEAEEYIPKNEISTYSTRDGTQVLRVNDDYSDLPPYDKRRDTSDIEKLYAVKFPVSPTKPAIAAYIQKIYHISRFQKRHLRSDPQVSLLMQVGTKHLDVLIRETYSHVGWHNYGIEAIKKLATEQHKLPIFKALKNYNKYAEIIYQNGWHFEIQDDLINGLRNNRGYIPHAWIKAVSEFDRQDARAALVEYFKYGWNNHSTYGIIAGLKDIEPQLREALPVAWETARENNKHAMAELTSTVLELGYMPAFQFTISSLIDNANMQKHWFDAYALITRYTEQTGSPSEIMNWYKLNQYKIRFDTIRKIYTT